MYSYQSMSMGSTFETVCHFDRCLQTLIKVHDDVKGHFRAQMEVCISSRYATKCGYSISMTPTKVYTSCDGLTSGNLMGLMFIVQSSISVG